nr:MAG TPA: RNA polymerase I subunit [Caudoviricetes sp.]
MKGKCFIMKIDLFNTKEFIEINKLKPVTSAILFQRGNVPHPNGLISNEIFGITTSSRRNTFAYINLHNHFFHPHIYKAIRRMFRNIDKIINGEMYYRIDSSGRLVQDDENGETGLQFIYDNWEKINWTKNDEDNSEEFGMRNERINLLKKTNKDELFSQYQIVIPAFFRDIKTGSSSAGGETDDINNLYGKLIRLSSLLDRQGMFDFQFHSTNYNIQNTIIAIYDYFKHKLEKKNGMIRKYLMGKNVDYCIRTVITSPTYHADTVDDLKISFEYTLLPLAQCCSLMYPFIVKWVKDFFDRNIIQVKNNMILDGADKTIKIIDPESYFSDKYIKKLIDGFMKDPESRFNKIELPTNSSKPIYFKMTGKRMNNESSGELGVIDRPMTRTDLLYMACEDIAKDKHVQITRYPINKSYGIFFTKIRVGSTAKTVPMIINGITYNWYPDIDINTPVHTIPTLFLDATQFSNSYLTGIDGDYDGDQTTEKILFTQEANEEIERIMYSKKNYIDAKGKLIRDCGKEATQTFYVLTKDPFGEYRKLTDEEKKYFISLKKEDMTYSNFVKWFGKTTNTNDRKSGIVKEAKFHVCDTLTLTNDDYHLVPKGETIQTTVGRLVYNKMMVEGLGFDSFIPYQNQVMNKGGFKKFESTVGNALNSDVIDTHQMLNYINTRDWFGLQFHTTITASFTPATTKIPPSVKALKEKLLKENAEAIDKGDVRVVEKIEKELIDATMKELKDDIGMDLYTSGARGSVGNHLKNMYLMRGAVQNPYTKEYEIITNSLCDGLAKKDIATHSNVITSGAFPKAVKEISAAYKPRELLEHRIYTTISSEDLKL